MHSDSASGFPEERPPKKCFCALFFFDEKRKLIAYVVVAADGWCGWAHQLIACAGREFCLLL
jgi:hypothetical protein